jgi:uncharacterized protein
MYLSVKELEVRKIRFHTSFSPGSIEFQDTGLKQPAPLEVSGTAELNGAIQEIRVRGNLVGKVECTCDRCLDAMRIDVSGEFDLFYRPAETEWDAPEAGLSADEAEVGFYEGAGLELSDVVREQVLLRLPMQHICQSGCKGICPICGRNRNVEPCGCHVEEIDERWQALRDLTRRSE